MLFRTAEQLTCFTSNCWAILSFPGLSRRPRGPFCHHRRLPPRDDSSSPRRRCGDVSAADMLLHAYSVDSPLSDDPCNRIERWLTEHVSPRQVKDGVELLLGCWCANNLGLLHQRSYVPFLYAGHSWVLSVIIIKLLASRITRRCEARTVRTSLCDGDTSSPDSRRRNYVLTILPLKLLRINKIDTCYLWGTS
jgi:hypothetical protein